jgi:hypothetical protein
MSNGVNGRSIGGTITLGGTAQTIAAANGGRQGFWIQNQSAGDLYVSTLGAAVADQTSLRIPSGALYENPVGLSPVGAISIIGATTGQAFAGREY